MEIEALGSAVFVATLLVPFVSLIKKDSWSTQARQAVALGAALVAAIVGAFVDGNVDSVSEFVAYLGTARIVAETLYVQVFGGTALNRKLEAVGNDTPES